MIDVVLGNTWLCSGGPVSTDKRDTHFTSHLACE